MTSEILEFDNQSTFSSIIGEGLALRNSIEIKKGKTTYGTVGGFLKEVSENELIIQKGSMFTQYLVSNMVKIHQEKNRTFLQRYIYMSPKAKEKERRTRYWFNVGASIGAQAILEYGGAWVANKLKKVEQQEIVDSISTILYTAAMDKNEKIPLLNQAQLASFVKQLNLSKELRKSFKDKSPNLIDVTCDFSTEEKDLLAGLSYRLIDTKTNGEFSKNNDYWQSICEALRVDSYRRRNLFEKFKNREDPKEVWSDHIERVQTMFAEFSEIIQPKFSLDMDTLHRTARKIAAYHPKKKKRGRYLQLLDEEGLPGIIGNLDAYSGEEAEPAEANIIDIGGETLEKEGIPKEETAEDFEDFLETKEVGN